MPVRGSIAQRSVLIQPCDLRLITTENVDVEFKLFKLQTFQDILSFGNKNLSGLGELVIFENVNQTSFVMQVSLKTSLIRASSSVPSCLRTGMKNLDKKKVELIDRYVFNCSRLFQ